jgi:hypothetical protein
MAKTTLGDIGTFGLETRSGGRARWSELDYFAKTTIYPIAWFSSIYSYELWWWYCFAIIKQWFSQQWFRAIVDKKKNNRLSPTDISDKYTSKWLYPVI